MQTLLPRLTIAKTASTEALPRVGDSITYTVTATNVGPGDFTTSAPARVADDLSAVLDNATFNGDAKVDKGSAPAFQSPNLTWAGELASGESLTLTYSVTYRGTGDSNLVNSACVPASDTAPDAASCATVTVPAGNIRQWKTVKASSDPILANTELAYTLHFENTGGVDAPVTATDDMGESLMTLPSLRNPAQPPARWKRLDPRTRSQLLGRWLQEKEPRSSTR
ncbi:hypothetical protein [Leucobacter coleopterorum]|uniref:DUF7927 domain-containing protein n=1 Tax=Leucobacter coleopterorum TaxID=2714933 RepID=UPI003CC733A8